MLTLIFRAAALACPHLPPRLGRAFFTCVGIATYYLSNKARAACLANLKHVLGWAARTEPLCAAGQAAFRHVALSYFDILRAHALSDAQIEAEFLCVRGFEHLEAALQCGHGAIFGTAHFGAFNLLGHFLAARLRRRVVVLYEADRTPQYSVLVHGLRERGAVEMVPLAGGLHYAVKALRAGDALGMFLDPAEQRTGPVVDFMGAPACFPRGAVALALRHHSPLVIGFAVRLPDGHSVLDVAPPLWLAQGEDRVRDIQCGTQQIARLLESQIRQHPSQWQLLHRVWDN